MVSFHLYKLLHLIAVLLLFVSLGGLTLHAINGGDKASNRARRLVSICHGVALVVVLVSGFGALARLGVLHSSPPGWVWIKLVVWLLLGGCLVIPTRFPHLARPLFLMLPVLGGIAAWAALYKPF